MQAYPEPSDWSVLSSLLRGAQREGWRVAFLAGRVEIVRAAVAPNVVTLPGPWLREARAAGWQVARAAGGVSLALRHPAVRQHVELRLVG